jgi:hypothetical protein
VHTGGVTRLVLVVIVALAAACGDRHDAAPVTGHAGSARARPDAAPVPVPVGPDGLPIVCGDWKAAIDKLATCTALPARVRDSLIAVYQQASSGWGQLPDDAKRELVAACRAGADAVMSGARTACGWP